jgi:hypothetical protein
MTTSPLRCFYQGWNSQFVSHLFHQATAGEFYSGRALLKFARPIRHKFGVMALTFPKSVSA